MEQLLFVVHLLNIIEMLKTLLELSNDIAGMVEGCIQT